MHTTKAASELSGIAKSTVRLYTKEYADFLSPSAKPPTGVERRFTDDDIAVFRTVKALRDQGATSEEILEALQQGERYEPVEGESAGRPSEQPLEEQPRVQEFALELYGRVAAQFQAQIAQLGSERDYLRTQVDRERELHRETQAALLTAEKEAARLAGRLEALEGQKGSKGEQAEESAGETRRRGRWPWSKD